MPTSVGTKAKKKQLLKRLNTHDTTTENYHATEAEQRLESAILELENICLHILDLNVLPETGDGAYWQQISVNIITPVSLSLIESKGPRHFHYHYKHREDDASILHPVLEDPVEMLAKVCKSSLKLCQQQFIGIQTASTSKLAHQLEMALQNFLKNYEQLMLENA